MRNQIFKTRLTELLGIRHPLLCGGLGPGVSDGRYVAAVVNAGGMGFIVHVGYDDPGQFEEELKICRELTGGKGFGVNLYLSRVPGSIEKTIAQIPLLTQYGCTVVETAGQSPEPILPALREAGIKIIHKVPGVRYARSVSRLDVDAVIIVGNECGGHPGIYQIGTIVQAAQAPREIDMPVIIGGGIGTGSQLAAVLAMGGEGVIMGTRMMVAEEMWISRAYKEQLIAGNGTESVIIKKIFRDNHRVLANDSTTAVLALEAEGVTDFDAYRPHVTGAVTRAGYRSGDLSRGTYDWGHSVAFADAIEPVEAIFDRILDDAANAAQRLGGLTVNT